MDVILLPTPLLPNEINKIRPLIRMCNIHELNDLYLFNLINKDSNIKEKLRINNHVYLSLLNSWPSSRNPGALLFSQ